MKIKTECPCCKSIIELSLTEIDCFNAEVIVNKKEENIRKKRKQCNECDEHGMIEVYYGQHSSFEYCDCKYGKLRERKRR